MEHKNRMEGKKNSLNDTRLEKLENVGFRWAKRKGQASWDEKFVSFFELLLNDMLYGFYLLKCTVLL